MKKIFVLIIVLLFSSKVYAQDLKIGAQGAVLMDAKTGRVLWERNMDTPMAVASTTKIITAILAIESGKLDETVVISKRASAAPQVRLGLLPGEEYKLKDLLYPLMLQSSNDAAVAIAEHVGGSVEGFAELMNKKAAELGAKDTKFVTPNGLDEDDNHSTAYDMALIAKYALENEEFRNFIVTQSYSVGCKNKSKVFDVNNKDRLLREYAGAIGVKTGFTGKAGHCFVGAAEQNGVRLISVVLASGWGNQGKEQKWIDSKRLLTYGYQNFSSKKILDKDREMGTVEVLYSKEGKVLAKTKDEGFAMLRNEEVDTITVEKTLAKTIEAPVKKGEVLGSVTVYTSTGEKLFTTELVAKEDILRHDIKTSAKKIINNWLNSPLDSIM